jgi:hypothetical protein
MKRYEFTPSGVDQWQLDLYHSSVQDHAYEQMLIGKSLHQWVQQRFLLTPDQISYLYLLESQFVVLLQDALIDAINYQLPIRLQKDERRVAQAGSSDSVKVIAISKNTQQSTSIHVPDSSKVLPPPGSTQVEGSLLVHIYYKDS